MKFRLLVGCTLALAAASLVQAAPITFGFSGTVTQIPAVDPGGGIGFGTEINGQYIFDDATLDAIADPSQSSYGVFGPPFGLSVTIGTNSYNLADFLNIGVSNDVLGIDQYSVLALGDSLTVSLLLEDLGGGVFSSDALPITPPLLGSFAVREFRLSDSNTDVQIDGQIDALVCLAGCEQAPVPVPGTLALLGVGLLVGGWRRRQGA